jgi:hypothetical protein
VQAARRCRMRRLAAALTAGSVPDAGKAKGMATAGLYAGIIAAQVAMGLPPAMDLGPFDPLWFTAAVFLMLPLPLVLVLSGGRTSPRSSRS